MLENVLLNVVDTLFYCYCIHVENTTRNRNREEGKLLTYDFTSRRFFGCHFFLLWYRKLSDNTITLSNVIALKVKHRGGINVIYVLEFEWHFSYFEPVFFSTRKHKYTLNTTKKESNDDNMAKNIHTRDRKISHGYSYPTIAFDAFWRGAFRVFFGCECVSIWMICNLYNCQLCVLS